MMDIWVSTKEDNQYYKEMDELCLQDFNKNVLTPYKNFYKLKSGDLKKENFKVFDEVMQNLELNYGNKCSLKCSYCYLVDFDNKGLYPNKTNNKNEHVLNTRKLLQYFIKNKQTPKSIDMFGGDLFMNNIGIQVLEEMYNVYSQVDDNQLKPDLIMIPTNFTWISIEHKEKYVDEIIERFEKIGIRVGLSISFDGLFEQENRPLKQGYDKQINRNEKYIDKIFKLSNKYQFGFHPMVFSNKIENWIENFLWFQKMFIKYNKDPFSIYLLEVRNSGWSKEQSINMAFFMRFLVKFTKHFFQGEKSNKEFFSEILNSHSYNILQHPYTQTYRGIGCSLQTTFQINTQDLGVNQCHRNNYARNLGYYLQIDQNLNLTTKNNNYEFYHSLKNFEVSNQPYCETCLIKGICNGLCPGSQQENFKEPFTPIPETCVMEHMKILSIVGTFQEEGLSDYYMQNSYGGHKNQLNIIIDFLNENRDIYNIIKSKDNYIETKIKEFENILATDKKDIPIFNSSEEEIYYGKNL